MANPRYDKGDYNALCDVCGKQVKASELRQRWDGFMVCSRDWEPRHPQDFVRGVADVQAPKWTRPEPTDVYSNPGQPLWIAGFAIAGYAIPGTLPYTGGLVPPSTFTV